MQDAGVVGVLDVLHVELPVVGKRLGVAAEHDRRAAAHHAADPRIDLFAEMFLERRHVVRETAEDDAEGLGQPQLARVVLLHAERRRHAALALDAVLEGDLLEVALPVVAPGVIDAGERLGVAAALQRDQRAAMRAAVLEGIEFAVGVSGDDDRGVADEGRDEVAGVLHLDRQAEIIPGWPLEDALLLGGVDAAVLEDPVGHPRDAVARPGRQRGIVGSLRDLIQHVTSGSGARVVGGHYRAFESREKSRFARDEFPDRVVLGTNLRWRLQPMACVPSRVAFFS